VLAQRAGQAFVAGDDSRQEAAERVGPQEPARVDGRGLEEDRPDAAARAGGVVGDEVVRRQVVADEAR
jgi:hypothetical protein